MKVMRVSAGFYRFEYKGLTGEILKWDISNTWYAKLDGEDADDVCSSKRMAVEMAKGLVELKLKHHESTSNNNQQTK